MAQKATYLTEEGLKQLQAEMGHLRGVRRQEVAARIHKASESGGATDNADYEESKSEQAFVEGRILDIENILANAVVEQGHGALDLLDERSASRKAPPIIGDEEYVECSWHLSRVARDQFRIISKAAQRVDGILRPARPDGTNEDIVWFGLFQLPQEPIQPRDCTLFVLRRINLHTHPDRLGF